MIDERVVAVDGWPGMVGHNWGSEHAERWIWLHGTGFGGDEGAWLDVVLARLKIGPVTTPWSGFGGLCLDGEVHRLGGLSRTRSTRVDERPDRVDFSMTGPSVQVHGRVSAPPHQVVGWVYADPDGSEHHVAHCSIADLELDVEGQGHAGAGRCERPASRRTSWACGSATTASPSSPSRTAEPDGCGGRLTLSGSGLSSRSPPCRRCSR